MRIINLISLLYVFVNSKGKTISDIQISIILS